MNTRIALVAGLVSLLATAAGCARPDVAPAAASPRSIVAYGVTADPVAAPQSVDRSARFEVAPSVRPRMEMIGIGGFGAPVAKP
jgi:hypothetical protein